MLRLTVNAIVRDIEALNDKYSHLVNDEDYRTFLDIAIEEFQSRCDSWDETHMDGENEEN